MLDARDAFRKKDRARLAALSAQAAAERNPLAMWVDYWELTNRIGDADQAELSAFAQRWSGTYVEDRLRNDWLLELGRRRDWANFAAEYPRFRMNDDREVTCYALTVDALAGKDVKDAALAAWLAQRDADDGCALLASTLFDAKQIGAAERLEEGAPVDGHRPASRGPPGCRAARARHRQERRRDHRLALALADEEGLGGERATTPS